MKPVRVSFSSTWYTAPSALALCSQVAPPSVVYRATLPTATPWRESMKRTAYSDPVVPLFCLLQVTPPFVVWMIAPLRPTAHASAAEIMSTA